MRDGIVIVDADGHVMDRPHRCYQKYLPWTHAPEQMVSVISCVYGGLFEKFQRLRIGFMESGAGWIPFFMEHMDGEFEKRPWDAPLCKAKPSEWPHTVDTLMKRDDLNPRVKAKILGGNALGFYGLKA